MQPSFIRLIFSAYWLLTATKRLVINCHVVVGVIRKIKMTRNWFGPICHERSNTLTHINLLCNLVNDRYRYLSQLCNLIFSQPFVTGTIFGSFIGDRRSLLLRRILGVFFLSHSQQEL